MSISTFIEKHPEVGVAVALVGFMFIFSMGSAKFLTLASVTSIFTLAAELGIIAVGVSMLMVSGEFDLSVGSVLLTSTLIFTSLANAGVFVPIAFLLTLGACALIGLLNGIITIKLRIPSFITTLGTMMLWRGMTIFATGGHTIAWRAETDFLQILGGNPFSMFRMTGVWFVGLAVVFFIILHKTRYGNWVFATGGNLEAARNIGVNVNRVKLINFMICGLLAGLAGVCSIARHHAAVAQLGMGKELEAIAACVIGGNLLTGGRGTILGTFIGVFLLILIKAGLVMSGISSYLYLPITGVTVIVAVVFNTFTTRIKR